MQGIRMCLIFPVTVIHRYPGINKGPQVKSGTVDKMQSRRRSIGQLAILGGRIVWRNEPRAQNYDVQNSQEHNQPRSLTANGSKPREAMADWSSRHVLPQSEFENRISSATHRQSDFPRS